MSKGVQIAVGATLVALLLGWLAASNLEEGATFQYFQTLEEFRAQAAAGQPVRVHGFVALESIERDLEQKAVRFRVQEHPPLQTGNAPSTLSVVYQSLETPDLFKDGAEVVIEGTLEGNGEEAIFIASNVLAKCPSKFKPETTESVAF